MKSEKTYFFLSGLPRSGITLLGAILNQNPDIYVSPTSPVIEFIKDFTHVIVDNNTYKAFPKEEFLQKSITKICNDWYSDIDNPIIIDKNRSWSSQLAEARIITKDIKIICPVRSILDILSSFILLNGKYSDKVNGGTGTRYTMLDINLMANGERVTDNNHCHNLMDTASNGPVASSLNGLSQLFVENRELFQNIIHLVEYEDLISDTKNIMNKIYEFLQIPKYEHDYTNIKNNIREDDTLFGMPTLHDVRPIISKSKNDPLEVLDKSIIKQYSGLEFWR
jgi:sulfotransferase